MNKILDAIVSFIKLLAGPLDWLIPEKFKGWKTVVVNFIAGLLTVLEGFDAINLFEAICNTVVWVGELFGNAWTCSPEGAAVVWTAIITFLNMLLRALTDTPVGKRG